MSLRYRQMTIRLANEQGGRCAYCGFVMMLPSYRQATVTAAMPMSVTGARRARRERMATRDHIIPQCDGGSDRWDNLVAACQWCNRYRANQPAEVAFERIQKRIRKGSHPHQQFERTGWWPSNSGGLRSLPRGTADLREGASA